MLQLKDWLQKNEDGGLLNSIPSIAADNLGLFLFLKYCAINGDLPSAIFVESIAKFKVMTNPPRYLRRHCDRFRFKLIYLPVVFKVIQFYTCAANRLGRYQEALHPQATMC